MTEREPKVSFVVPCYRLAHLLPQCVDSILKQTFGDLEILIMDDCSPDNTASVAQSFADPRVKYVRNEQNLGHLRNYNKGIEISRGKYVWLISADDYLRSPRVLERYVEVLEHHPNVGYAFCPGYGVRDGLETRILGEYKRWGHRDRLIRGHTLLSRLLKANFVLTPSGMVRKECYTKLSYFDLSMPWCGDWYLWCLFALHYDVAYFAEPMVCYREHHDLSMTSQLIQAKLDACAAEEIAVTWTIFEKAKEAGFRSVAIDALGAIAHTYARVMYSKRYHGSSWFMNMDRFEASIATHALSTAEEKLLRAHFNVSVGNEHYGNDRVGDARECYKRASRINPLSVEARAKALWATLGRPGRRLHTLVRSFV